LPNDSAASTSPAQVVAAQLMASFAKLGVRQVFLAPGARSQALAIAAGQLAAAGLIDLHVHLDERSLGFNALGSALGSGEPSIVITTSGTAVANLHPAVLEASHSGVPMILLTADRPAELRGVGSNQTTNQVGIFGDAVRECVDVPAPTEADTTLAGLQVTSDLAARAVSISLGWTRPSESLATDELLRPGPVQLNVCFREPLSGPTPNAAELNFSVALSAREGQTPKFAVLTAALPTVVVAGAGAGEGAVEFAESYGLPLLAEPSSGARFGANAIIHYRNLLAEQPALVAEVKRAVVFGKPTLGRAAIALLKREDVEVIVVRNAAMGFFDVSRRASQQVDELVFDDEVPFDWLEKWRALDAAVTFDAAIDELNRANIVREVWAATTAEDDLLLGASRMIREADAMAPAKPIRIFANRGLAGIDGTIATANGISLHNAEGTTRVLLGDLTLLHDAGSLAGDALGGATNDLQLVVVNDGGGSIFESLEMASQLEPTDFDRLFRTPQKVDIWSLAQAYGWQHVLVISLDELRSALATGGRVIIEIDLRR
jgi:2-succinyl-5-enolpyruvyl-6-hydroxy-3-cyclohexene-1-carboxylate synthase